MPKLLKRGNSRVSGTGVRFRREPVVECPITGLQVHVSDLEPHPDGYWVHPIAADLPGNEQKFVDPGERPMMYRRTRRRRAWRE